MRPVHSQPSPAIAILTLAEIKAAIEGFDLGVTNGFDALAIILVAVETYQSAMASHRDAA